MKYLFALLLLCELAFGQATPKTAKEILGADWRASCSIRPPAKGLNPDQTLVPGDLLGNTMKSFTDVLTHNGKSTNAGRNEGICSYMTASVLADDQLFNAALKFYTKIRELDRAAPNTLCGIQQTAAYDAFALAKKAANGDVYLALKVITMFGHDNLQTSLGNPGDAASGDCKVQVLNKLRPGIGSNLFCAGALPGLGYKQATIDRGVALAAQCNQSFMTLYEKKLCNDGYTNYQADYYHVTTSAFLSCRRAISEKASGAGALSTAAVSVGAEQAHLQLIKHYKLERFKEDVDGLTGSKDLSQIQLQLLLRYALARVATGKTPVLPSYANYGLQSMVDGDLPSNVDARTYKVAQAIAERYEFETGFRLEQHRMGQAFAKANCDGYKERAATVAEDGVKTIVYGSASGKAVKPAAKVPAK